MPSLKDIVAVPQNGGRDLRRHGIVWLHLLKCKKRWCAAGVADSPFVSSGILSSIFSNVVNHQEYYLTRRGVINGHPELFVYFDPRDGHFCYLPIFCINVSKNAGNSGRANM